jgi:predicted AlkP superfamily pyrophosphatase or phosphodiesterase
MQRTLVLNVVGLTGTLLAHAPNLRKLASSGTHRPLSTVMPAVTCSAQATFLTGVMPSQHGIVANGWYSRELAEPLFWKQNNGLIQSEKIWHEAKRRDPDFTCAQLFWWFNMYADVDWSVTPRPIYKADGRKLPDFYSNPAELHDELEQRLGEFPLFRFWGPAADIVSTKWIADCAQHVYRTRKPTLTLVYLPHLDYQLQRVGPDHASIPAEVAAVDQLCGELIEMAQTDGTRVIVLSEYGITNVRGDIQINRALRRAGLLAVRDERGEEKLDPGASEAFALTDHQLAHVYVRRPELLASVRKLIEDLDGVERVLGADEKRAAGLDHERSGELIAVSRSDRWFSYYYWLDDAKAPDFARTVEIFKKPGFDPAELFIDPAIRAPKVKIGMTLLKKAAGMRTLMDVIPLHAEMVGGSHGRITDDPAAGPVFISSEPDSVFDAALPATSVRQVILSHVFAGDGLLVHR